MIEYTKKILDAIFPPKCAGCNKIAESIICGDCMSQITRRALWPCHKCRNPPYLCSCKGIRYIDELAFPYFYDGEKLKFAISKLKKANLYYINEFFAKSMYNSVKTGDKINLGEIDLITCVPRVRKSMNLYGYNQSENLARLVSKYSGIKFERTLNAKNKQDQKSLSRSDRALNVQGKFAAIKKASAKIKGRNIIIIDDVTTGGSTLSECAMVLKEAGSGKIYALCAASALN